MFVFFLELRQDNIILVQANPMIIFQIFTFGSRSKASMAPKITDVKADKLARGFSSTHQLSQEFEEKENPAIDIPISLITLVEKDSFLGEENEEILAHFWTFMHNCRTFKIKGVSQDIIHYKLFPFTL